MEKHTVTISEKAPLTFNGVTIRKAMLANGDYLDIKAFNPNPNAPERQYLTKLMPNKTYEIEGKLRTSNKGFRELVIDSPAAPVQETEEELRERNTLRWCTKMAQHDYTCTPECIAANGLHKELVL